VPARKPTPPPDDPEEYRRFVDMAREVEADERPEAFENAFERVVKPIRVTPAAPRSRRTGKRDAS
jgi:hypothetical protein